MKAAKLLRDVTAGEIPRIIAVTGVDGTAYDVAKRKRLEQDIPGRYIIFLVQLGDGYSDTMPISLESLVYLVAPKVTP